MKTIQVMRIINATLWAVALVAVLALVLTTWHDNGCEVESLAAAVVFYSAGAIGLGLIVDQHLREQLKRYE